MHQPKPLTTPLVMALLLVSGATLANYVAATTVLYAEKCQTSQMGIHSNATTTLHVVTSSLSTLNSRISILVNTRHIAACRGTSRQNSSQSTATSNLHCVVEGVPCRVNEPWTPLSIAVYATTGSDEHPQHTLLHLSERLSDVSLWPGVDAIAEMEHVKASLSAVKQRPRVLAYVTVENTPQAQTYQNMSFNRGGQPVNTVESVVGSADTLLLSDLCPGNNTGPYPVNCLGTYHATPMINGTPQYYCFYRKRTSEKAGLAPDCANISTNVEWLASTFQTTGVDVLIPDTTNLQIYPDPNSDLLNVRPVEVLAEEFTRLRQKGAWTPKMAIWTTAATNSSMYTGFLPIYNNYSSLMLKDDAGKYVYFVDGRGNAKGPDPNVIHAINSNGGRNNIDVIGMWANIDEARAATAEWTFFQPCQTNTSASATFTLTILNEDGYRCNHLISYNSSLGSSASVAMSWQADYASFVWASPGKAMGLTFQAQFDDALRSKPDNLMLPSFNEWNSGSTDMPASWAKGFGSVGLAPADQNKAFVDIYGIERGRTWEPTVEGGDYYLRLTASCIRVAALLWSSKVTECNVQGELCCNRTFANYNRVFSLARNDGSDRLLTISSEERNSLVNGGQWHEVCATSASSYSTTYFCYQREVQDIIGREGPFLLYSSGDVPPPTHASKLNRFQRVAIYRCRDTTTGRHFMARSPNCTFSSDPGEMRGSGPRVTEAKPPPTAVMESVLGFAAAQPSTAMPRMLRLCQTVSDSVWYHTTDAACAAGDQQLEVLGFLL